MIYKLYIDRTKKGRKLTDKEMKRVFNGFQDIYRKYEVMVIGAWENVEDDLESYLITEYQDEIHYEKTIAKIRANPEYKKLSKELQDTRDSIKIVTLKPLPGSS